MSKKSLSLILTKKTMKKSRTMYSRITMKMFKPRLTKTIRTNSRTKILMFLLSIKSMKID